MTIEARSDVDCPHPPDQDGRSAADVVLRAPPAEVTWRGSDMVWDAIG